MSRDEVEQHTGINGATLYRIETAQSCPQKRTLLALLNAYGVTDPQRAELVEMCRNAGQQGWLRPYHAELPEEYATYISFEAEARSVRNYESLYVPGLLQTEDYARAVIKGTLPTASQREVEHRVQARMERQALLGKEDPLQLWAIMDEAAVRRQVGGREAMRAQVQRILAAAEEPNVTVQVIPFDKGAHPGMPGAFVHMDFPEPADPQLVYVDTLAGDLLRESEADIGRYTLMFEHLRAVALGPDDTARLLATIADA